MIEKLNYSDKQFPSLLKEISQPPQALYKKGRLPGKRPYIAIVGTRKATAAGKKIAKDFARALSERGFVIVSGLAMGIDTAAHEGALDAKSATVAVLANGLDTIYPRQNERLAENIIKNEGGLVSEYKEGTPSFPNQFIARNRIISGLSLGVIIIEAPERSGALATARFALEQNREVLVVPGSIYNPNYVGSHRLIKDGAALVMSLKDILETLNISTEPDQTKSKNQELFGKSSTPAAGRVDNKKEHQVVYTGLNSDEKAVLEAIIAGGRPATIDEISLLTDIEPRTVSRAISVLTIKNFIFEQGGRYHNHT